MSCSWEFLLCSRESLSAVQFPVLGILSAGICLSLFAAVDADPYFVTNSLIPRLAGPCCLHMEQGSVPTNPEQEEMIG